MEPSARWWLVCVSAFCLAAVPSTVHVVTIVQNAPRHTAKAMRTLMQISRIPERYDLPLIHVFFSVLFFFLFHQSTSRQQAINIFKAITLLWLPEMF